MSKVIVVTDSNSGITPDEAKKLGVEVIPMPFYIDEQMYYENIDLTQEQFYEKLTAGGDIKTSMPLVGDVTDKWDEFLKENDEIVYIPMSSGLSSSCETAYMLSQDYDGKVQVVNNQRISVTMRQSVIDAKNLAEAGKNAAEQQKIAANADKNYRNAVYNLDNLKNLVKENPNVVGPYAPIGAAVSRYTGGTFGMKADDLRKRGEVIRNLGSIRNDLIAQAKANGQSGINTAREIEMATAGLNENSSAEEILGALDYMTEAAKKIHELSVSDMVTDDVVDYSDFF